jgi:NAD(P)-dependent dehydrogenase (short-subunit alcohol dehydrogenase family)
MGALDGRVAIITGAGRGLGREHAMLFASEGAKVVVNDLGGESDGSGGDIHPAQQTVADIKAAGGEAVVNGDNVADWEGAQRLINTAIETFGKLDVLVNNAGILRDRVIVNTTEEEWDSVIQVHLKGHFLPLKFAGIYWREQSKAGTPLNAAVVNTSSTSGLFPNAGQANYGAAKAGIAAMTLIAQKELTRYGVRCNAICPVARTRLTEGLMGGNAGAPTEGFDTMHPGNVSPMVAYLSTADCPIKGRTFLVAGNQVSLFHPWSIAETITNEEGRWTIAGLQKEAAHLADVPFNLNSPYAGG